MGDNAIEKFYIKNYEQIIISLEDDKSKLKQRLE